MTLFINSDASHKHSLQTLNMLYEYDDFMESVRTVVDLGCGEGQDLEWWATATTRDEYPRALNITCIGVDQAEQMPLAKKYVNMSYQSTDFEGEVYTPKKSKYDVLWCHDAFQYAINPIQTLSRWWNIANENSMLVLILPQTTIMQRNQLSFYQHSGCYYHYSMVNLIQMLAVAGWDCRSGFFKKNPTDNWLHAVVYRSAIAPMNPKKTTWYDLVEKKLLPESADKSILAHGYLRQQDLMVPWLDHSLSILGNQ
jgi:hypothetical protein